MQANSACFLPVVDENRIVYDRLQTTKKLYQKSGCTPKEETVSTTSSSATPPTVEPVNPAPSATPSMVKTLHDYSTPAVANVPVWPAVNIGYGNFELHTCLITMVQANQFHGLPSEDANYTPQC